MFSVSDKFRKAIQSTARTDKVEGTIVLKNDTTISFVDKDIKSDTLTIDNQCINGEELEFGAVYAGQLSFTLKTEANRYALYDGKITLKYSLKLANGTWESVPMGVYYITEAVRQGVYIKITALDSMIKLNTDFDGVSVLGTPFQILTHIGECSGVELGNTEEEIKAMTNGNMTFQIDSTCDVSAWIDGVSIIAQAMGAFATATRDGKFAICQFSKTPDLEVIGDQRFNTDISDFQSSYMGLRVVDANGNTIESYSEATEGLIMEISGNALFDVGLDDHKQELVDNIRKELCSITYTPSDISCSSDPTIECGDMITYNVNGDKINSVLSSYAWQYRGKQKLKATGKNPYFTNNKNRAEKTTAGLRQQVNESKIIFENYTNIAEYTIAQDETRIIEMTITSTAKSNSLFFAQILLDVTPETAALEKSGGDGNGNTLVFNYSKDKPCQLTFIYYVNGVEVEEYHPIDHYDAGDHIIALHYPLPDMEKNTTIRFIVAVKTDSGSAYIGIKQIKATVIGNGLVSGSPWDGTITITEFVPLFDISSVIGFNALNESVIVERQTPIPNVVIEQLHSFEFTSNRIEINGLTERIGQRDPIDFIVKSFTLSANSPEYNADYVTDDGGYTLRTEWVYNSERKEIDAGSMSAIQIITSGLATVDEIGVR